jgi:hypothetical protein
MLSCTLATSLLLWVVSSCASRVCELIYSLSSFQATSGSDSFLTCLTLHCSVLCTCSCLWPHTGVPVRGLLLIWWTCWAMPSQGCRRQSSC